MSHILNNSKIPPTSLLENVTFLTYKKIPLAIILYKIENKKICMYKCEWSHQYTLKKTYVLLNTFHFTYHSRGRNNSVECHLELGWGRNLVLPEVAVSRRTHAYSMPFSGAHQKWRVVVEARRPSTYGAKLTLASPKLQAQKRYDILEEPRTTKFWCASSEA